MPTAVSGLEAERQIRPLRYGLMAGASTLLAALLFGTALSGTSEFLWITAIMAVVLGFIPGVIIGLVAVLLVTLFLGVTFKFWLVSPGQRQRAGGICILFPLVMAAVFSIGLMRPRKRLESLLRPPLPPSVGSIRVAGFDGFLARRWYATFTIATNDLPVLLKRLELASSTNLDTIPNLISDRTFAPSALDAGVIPRWKPSALWSRSKQKGATEWWQWLAVDETGTNVFFTKGYQN